MELLWGIDLGGTKIEGVVMEPGAEPRTIARRRIPTEAPKGYEHIVARIAEVVSLLEAETGLKRPSRIGIGTPGSFDPTTGIQKNSNTTCLNGKPLKADVSRALGVELAMANDANCFALAEATFGAAKGLPVVFGVILGTGVGGGLVVNGKALHGRHGIAGEWGHNVLIPDGPACYCGKRGCVECVLSGPAIEREHAERTGARMPLKEIAASSDPACQTTIERLCDNLGVALSVVVDIVDPDAIVLGGGVGNIAKLYTLGQEALTRHVFNPVCNTPLLKPVLGDSAGVFGAAMLTV